jgi:hypothetical protein
MTKLLTALLLVTACGIETDPAVVSTSSEDLKAASSGSSKKSQPPPAPTYTLRTSSAEGSSPVFATSFAIFSTGDVDFAFDIDGTCSGHHTGTLDVFMPSGFAYQAFNVPFATDVAAGADEYQAVRTASGWRVWVSLPVAGTAIETSNIAGAWSAQMWLDAAQVPTASASFSLY